MKALISFMNASKTAGNREIVVEFHKGTDLDKLKLTVETYSLREGNSNSVQSRHECAYHVNKILTYHVCISPSIMTSKVPGGIT